MKGACSTRPTFLDVNVTVGFYTISAAVQLRDHIVAYSTTAVEVLARAIAESGERHRTQYGKPHDSCNRANVINAVIEQQGYASYLEVGVFDGVNYERIKCAHKESVDPSNRYGKPAVPPLYLYAT